MTNQHRLHSQTPQPDRGRAQTHVHRAHTKPYQEKTRLLVSIRSLQLSISLLARHFALPVSLDEVRVAAVGVDCAAAAAPHRWSVALRVAAECLSEYQSESQDGDCQNCDSYYSYYCVWTTTHHHLGSLGRC